MRKTFKYKLMPTPEQDQALERVLWCCRTLYNAALEERKTAWERCRVSVGYYQQKAELPDLKADFPAYTEVHSQVLQDVLKRLERAFQAFFRRLKAVKQPGYPRFQGRNRYNSFTYPQYGNGVVLDGGILSLSKIGCIPLRLHRPLQGTAKTLILAREADGWYVCVCCADVPVVSLPSTGYETGMDVGLKVFLITADGATVASPRHYRKAEQHLNKAQRRLSRRKQESKRRRKAVQLLKRKHQRVRRQRTDFHHQTALLLLRTYDTLYLEDLRVANLVRNPHLAKSISDAGWAAFRTILDGKAAYAGRQVVAVPPAFTSQDCSGCGERVPKSLSVRTHICTNCGLIVDRDENAARNIQWAGQVLRGVLAVA